jgi:hypothetical protein
MRRFMTDIEFDEKFAPLYQALQAHRQARSTAPSQEPEAWLDDEEDMEDSAADDLDGHDQVDVALRVDVGHIELDEQDLYAPVNAEGRTYPWFQVVNLQGEGAAEARTCFAALPTTKLTSGGQSLEWRLTADGSMLYAYSGNQEVLRLVVESQPGAAPGLQAALLAPIDHPVGQPLLKLQLELVSRWGSTQQHTQMDVHILDAPAAHPPVVADTIQILESAPFLHLPASSQTYWLAK